MRVTAEAVIAALYQHKNVLLYGPPGTGKSYLMNEVARRFAGAAPSQQAIFIDTDAEAVPLVTASAHHSLTRWVTFHQGYSYEDFILGLRPQATTGGSFNLVPRPGVLLEIAAEAQTGVGLLLIDEINRGNTSRIFGEFITLMEPDKRLDPAGNVTETTIVVTLPYLAPDENLQIADSLGAKREISRNFAMPSRIYTLASMNSVDKSVAPIDTALRRRFHIVNLFPAKEDLKIAAGLDSNAELAGPVDVSTQLGVAALAVRVVERLNHVIGLYLGQEFMLGQWYLGALKNGSAKEASNTFAEIWLYRLLPQLLELFNGRSEVLIRSLGLDENTEGSGLQIVQPSSTESDLGASWYLVSSDTVPGVDLVIAFLTRLVST